MNAILAKAKRAKVNKTTPEARYQHLGGCLFIFRSRFRFVSFLFRIRVRIRSRCCFHSILVVCSSNSLQHSSSCPASVLRNKQNL